MPVPTRFRNNDMASHAVYRYIKTLKPFVGHLTLRPFNPYQPAYSEWYLIPSTEWPAYRFGKLLMGQARGKPELMNLCYYVERGFSAQVAGIAKSTEVMDASWYWPRFSREAQAGALDEVIQIVMERTGLPVFVYFSLYHLNHLPDPETGEQRPDDQIGFLIRDSTLAFNRRYEAKNELSPLNEGTDLGDAIRRVEALPNLEWNWINLLIGVQVRYSEDDTGDWGAREIWHNVLEPWLPWVH
jgi:hypothetical protein